MRTEKVGALLIAVVGALLCAVLSGSAVIAANGPPPPGTSPALDVGGGTGGRDGAGPMPAGATRRQVGASEKKWEFERFDSEIVVHDDGSFTVRETQVVNFTGSFSFLTRDIPTRMAYFDEGRTYGKVRVKDVQVYNLDGTPYDGGLWETDSYAGGELVRINFQARDEQRGWIISYRMQGAIIYAEDYDRLYWNAVSHDRAAPIKHARISVELPAETDMSAVRSLDYYGDPGNSSHRSGRSGKTVWWEAENIYPYTDFTIDVSLPKGLVRKPWPYRASTLWLMLLVAAGCFLGAVLIMLALWFWRGRDAYGGPRPGVSYGAPQEQRPAIVAMLMHQHPRIEDVAATVVDLAVRGKLRIIEAPEEKIPGRKSFVFERRDASEKDLLPYERTLMKAIFAAGERVEEDDLKVGTRFLSIVNAVRKEVKKRRLFHDDPERTVGTYFRTARAVLLIPPLVLFILRFCMDMGYLWVLLAGTLAAGVAVWVIGHAMPKRTAIGSRLFWQAMGFREYLRTAEAGEPESMTLQSFQENLPYAMVMGMADRWAALFADVLTSSPEWYSGAEPAFSTTRLASSLNGMATTLYISGLPKASSSSSSAFHSGFGGGGFGGGSSGGGFGGGGSSAG